MIHLTGRHGTLQVVLGILQPPLKVSLLEKWIFYLVCNLAVHSRAGFW